MASRIYPPPAPSSAPDGALCEDLAEGGVIFALVDVMDPNVSETGVSP